MQDILNSDYDSIIIHIIKISLIIHFNKNNNNNNKCW